MHFMSINAQENFTTPHSRLLSEQKISWISQIISTVSKIYAKNSNKTRFVCFGVNNIIQLAATQSLLPSALKPKLYTSPINLHTRTIITKTSITRYKYNYGAEIYFYK